MSRKAVHSRETNETSIQLEINPDKFEVSDIETGVPFFNHLLEAMAFHGRFTLKLRGRGDLAVDPHHLVEDTGLVFGEVLHKLFQKGAVERFSQALIPMDDALAEVVVDVSGRPFLCFSGTFPQERIGSFDTVLIREFLTALANRARITLHVTLRYGQNSHHLAEALFKALGRALAQAYHPLERNTRVPGGDAGGGMSTKGSVSL